MRLERTRRAGFALALGVAMGPSFGQPTEPAIEAFLNAASYSRREAEAAQEQISAAWRSGYAAMLVDLLDVVVRTRGANPRTFMAPDKLIDFLEQQTGQSFGEDLEGWKEWVWSQPYAPHPRYGEFKGKLYAKLDPRFVVFFRSEEPPKIRLDEIQWGGVSINGIPPLDHPKHIPAAEAAYLEDDNIVFGFFLDGEARAYPKRILAWHELALDRVGERELAIVYCTLCGTVIPFDAKVDGKVLTFGTSGLLYRSNKLMFDHETASLWSSLTGEPVVGPLVQLDLKLKPLPVVTTTWGEWRARHPDTRVLSLDTGFTRDYSEGAAYRAYFGTDELMFGVALRDGRLPNKAEVLVIRSTAPAFDAVAPADDVPPFAIAATFLAAHPVYQTELDGTKLVVVTSPAGANRVYSSEGFSFVETDGSETLRDSEGRAWTIGEDFLTARFDAGIRLPRIAAHRAFWFGWYAQHPDTVLIGDQADEPVLPSECGIGCSSPEE
jgi:hypothetical protein